MHALLYLLFCNRLHLTVYLFVVMLIPNSDSELLDGFLKPRLRGPAQTFWVSGGGWGPRMCVSNKMARWFSSCSCWCAGRTTQLQHGVKEGQVSTAQTPTVHFSKVSILGYLSCFPPSPLLFFCIRNNITTKRLGTKSLCRNYNFLFIFWKMAP